MNEDDNIEITLRMVLEWLNAPTNRQKQKTKKLELIDDSQLYKLL